MLKLYSTIFGKLLTGLYDWELSSHMDLLDEGKKNEPLDSDDVQRISHHLAVATNMADELGLDAASVLIQRMWKQLND